MRGRIPEKLTTSIRSITSRRPGLAVLIVVVTIAANYLLFATRSELKPIENPERVWPVNVIPAQYKNVQPGIHLFGEVVAGRHSELRPLVEGIVVAVGENLHDGGVVKQGELLVQIDPFDYETNLEDERWLLQQAEARLAMLRRELERIRKMRADSNASEQMLDNAELDVVEQESAVGQQRVALRRAERDLAETTLTAPYDGVLSGVTSNLGTPLRPADKLVDLIDTSRLEVRMSLSKAQYGRLLEGGETLEGRLVQVGWKIGARILNFDAMIKRVGAEIKSTTGGVDVYAVVDSNGEQISLRPGAFVSVTLADKLFTNVLETPDSALYGENTVYIVEDRRLQARRIRIQGYSGTNILFSSAGEPGIDDGDLIVTTQLREAGVGAKVEVRER
jgi:RND family efflux transporter MFP subunit